MTTEEPEAPIESEELPSKEMPALEETAPLGPPTGISMGPGSAGGWSIVIRWEYSFRYPEIESFEVSRLKKGDALWEVVGADIRNEVRTYTDMLPDEEEYTYTVTAIPSDGSGPLVANPPTDASGEVIYIRADAETTIPQNIRKPLRSTSQKMFVTWDYHTAASSYYLEALDGNGDAYYSVHVTDVFAPYGLFIGPHPDDMVNVRVTVMRRRDDGMEYPASSATAQLAVDDITDPHFAVVDIEGQESRTLLNRNLAYSVVLGLAEYGTEIAQLTVNGVVYENVWIDHGGHKSATIETCYPAGTAVTAAMRIAAPDNLQDGGGGGS